MCFLSHLSMCACNYKILSEAVHSPFWAQTDRHIEWDFFWNTGDIFCSNAVDYQYITWSKNLPGYFYDNSWQM